MPIKNREKITAIITARGGSKRISDKNVKILHGKPLLWYPIRDARRSRYIDDFYVSTDRPSIADVAFRYGAKVIDRPKRLATDNATSDSVLEHAIKSQKLSGLIVLLQPTAPLRNSIIVDRCIELFLRNRPSILVTMGPHGTYTGSVYIFDIKDYKKAGFQWRKLLHQKPYIQMMSARHELTNINYMEDWKMAEKLSNVKDKDFQPYSFNVHLAKEQEFADKIGRLQPYIFGQENLLNLKKQDNDMYLKLRDNPERVKLLSHMPCGTSVIDVGCSEGLITLAIATNHKKSSVLGIDIRPEAINTSLALREKFPDDVKQRTKFTVGLPDDLIKTRKKFDTVFFTEVLEHIDHTEHAKVVKQVAQLLKRAGNLVISIPNRYPAEKYEKEGRHRWNAPAHLSYFGLSNFETLLKQKFGKVVFHSLPQDKKPQDGIWLLANCSGIKA